MTSIFDLDAALRRVRPERRTQRLIPPVPVALLPDDADPRSIGPVLLDTCVFIDNGHNRLPIGARRLLAARGLVHVSSVTGMELAYAFGRLDPADAPTERSLHHLRFVLDRAPVHRVVTATPADYALAGVLAGTLARTQGLTHEARRKLLLDCVIFSSARRHGLTVLTANHSDFSLLAMLLPDGKAAFYRAVGRLQGPPSRRATPAQEYRATPAQEYRATSAHQF